MTAVSSANIHSLSLSFFSRVSDVSVLFEARCNSISVLTDRITRPSRASPPKRTCGYLLSSTFARWRHTCFLCNTL